ncbi:MAG: hypothetical protein V1794_19235 [Candidatus Glassbacteria bacterium]
MDKSTQKKGRLPQARGEALKLFKLLQKLITVIALPATTESTVLRKSNGLIRAKCFLEKYILRGLRMQLIFQHWEIKIQRSFK